VPTNIGLLQGHPKLECLDIGSASTLGGLANVSFNDVSVPDAPQLTLFGSTTDCSAKTVSDGMIGPHDFAVILWSHFRVAPYDTLPLDKSAISTNVQGRDSTQQRCGSGTTRAEYQVQLGTDFCAAGFGEASSGRRLSDGTPQQIGLAGDADAGSDTALALPRRMQALGTPSVSIGGIEQRAMTARVTQHAEVPGTGSWTRVELLEDGAPVNVLTAELLLVGVGEGSSAHDLSFEPPPPQGCSTPDCAPKNSATLVTVAFKRRAELLQGRSMSECASYNGPLQRRSAEGRSQCFRRRR